MPELTPGQKTLFASIDPLKGANIIEKLAGGPASHSWLLSAGDEKFVLRMDRQIARRLGLNRQAELEILNSVAAAGIGPKVVWADPVKGILVTSYISGNAWNAVDVQNPVKLEKLATTLRHLHSIPPKGPAFMAEKSALLYAKSAGTEKAMQIANQVAVLAKKLLSETKRTAICHNDLVYSNIIGDGPVRLIDWEYSAVGDPFFDLAIVVRHHQLNAERTACFFKAYSDKPVEKHLSRLESFCRLYDQLAALWYLSVIRQAGQNEILDEELNRILTRL